MVQLPGCLSRAVCHPWVNPVGHVPPITLRYVCLKRCAQARLSKLTNRALVRDTDYFRSEPPRMDLKRLNRVAGGAGSGTGGGSRVRRSTSGGIGTEGSSSRAL